VTVPGAIEVYDEALLFLTSKLTIAPRTQGKLDELRAKFMAQLAEPKTAERTLVEVYDVLVRLDEGQSVLLARTAPTPVPVPVPVPMPVLPEPGG
jgi:hypothetical protein